MPIKARTYIQRCAVIILTLGIMLTIGIGATVYIKDHKSVMPNTISSSDVTDNSPTVPQENRASGKKEVVVDIALGLYLVECLLILVGIIVLVTIQRHWFTQILIFVTLVPAIGFFQLVFLLLNIYCENCAGENATASVTRLFKASIPGLVFLGFVSIAYLVHKHQK